MPQQVRIPRHSPKLESVGFVADNLERIRAEIVAACIRAGRPEDAVRLMAVSKTHPVDAIAEAYVAGQRLFGENRVQEAQSKLPELMHLQELELHLIGPLQSNKTAKAAETFSAIESVDSLRIAQRLDAACATLGKVLPVMVEVKLSEEDSKHGCAPDALPALLAGIAACPHLELAGLMTVPEYTEDPEGARGTFATLRTLLEKHQTQYPTLRELSMGMSHDFVAAIAEGSTLVRVGTAIFGSRPKA